MADRITTKPNQSWVRVIEDGRCQGKYWGSGAA